MTPAEIADRASRPRFGVCKRCQRPYEPKWLDGIACFTSFCGTCSMESIMKAMGEDEKGEK